MPTVYTAHMCAGALKDKILEGLRLMLMVNPMAGNGLVPALNMS